MVDWDKKMHMLVMEHKTNVVFLHKSIQLNMLLTEASLNPEKMTRIMFETFNAPAFDAAVLSLYAGDRICTKNIIKKTTFIYNNSSKRNLQDIQEKLLYVALDYEDKLHNEEISSEYDN